MGSKPSTASGTVDATEGVQKVCQVPSQARTASAPPTPLHPEGAPRSISPGIPEIKEDRTSGSQSHSDAWMPGMQADTQTAPAQSAASEGATTTVADGAAAGAAQARSTQQPQALCFDVPLEEVLSLATEAFGQIAASLPSPKWDRRVQALKGVGSVLRGVGLKVETIAGAEDDALAAKASGVVGAEVAPQRGSCRGLQLRDRSRCFRAACLVLHIAMRDKVLPVLLAAHELYRLAFEQGQSAVPQEEAGLAMTTLLPHLLAKLGDLNIRLHESACASVVFSANQHFFGLAEVFERLRSLLEESTARGPQRMRMHAGVLEVVGQLLRRFPGRRPGEGDESDAVATWTPGDVEPFIAGGAAVDGVTGSRVQQAAAGLAVTVCETLGRAALEPLIRAMPGPAQEVVVSRLKDEALEDDDEDGEDDEDGIMDLPGVENLCVMGIGLRPPMAPQGPRSNGLTSHKEECIMDEILEETGLVFEGQGLKVAAQAKTGSTLDEDLRGLGLEGVSSEWEHSDSSALLV